MAADKAEDKAESVVAMDACAAASVTDGVEVMMEGTVVDETKCKMGAIGVMEVVGNAEARTGKANRTVWLRGGAVAEGMVGRTGTAKAGDTVDMTEESEAEMVGNETGTERGDVEAMMSEGRAYGVLMRQPQILGAPGHSVGEMIGGMERHGCVGAGDAGKEGEGSPEWRGEMGDKGRP
ncbi:hypothetical protein F5148DRAFT_1155238 [Russula earlei]|uniref:Uncharacterized protein n=1 Tax=Russula earlei TaxID=71964 RepID=A0ACC0TS59_9AGAM|nr:hypothetical protein F5148DRAFT_1155238 [Russula earlei]